MENVLRKTERPILFSGPMVRAILEGRKTQTRRVIEPQPQKLNAAEFKWRDGLCDLDWMLNHCRYGQPGDRLWVREAFCNYGSGPVFRADVKDGSGGPWKPAIHMPRSVSRIELEVVGVRVERVQQISEEDAQAEGTVIHENPKCGIGLGRHMYAYSPGNHHEWELTATQAYCRLWDSINADRGYSWEKNPWVWVIEFKRAEAR